MNIKHNKRSGRLRPEKEALTRTICNTSIHESCNKRENTTTSASPCTVSAEKCVLDGYEIPAKTRVLINSYAVRKELESWENPTDYNPDRFVEVDIDFKDQDFRFLPFRGGRRGCPSYSFGLATNEITLARLLYYFDWELPHGDEADNVDLSETFGLATRKKTALVIVPIIYKDCQLSGNDI
ncbi:tryptamine 5-hydroxylase-like [Mercurialis annua]|uniref:tryptamine 5-hydroxylase-like n=1 Tax=Mercurialis annua TaxID=3986 RepID=UPI0024AD85EE|nr:tryptamine 5-hydroxylase-like [Mercurialis annua]